MDTCWRMVIRVMLVALLPLGSIAVFSGPSDTTVLLGGTVTLSCSFPEFTRPGTTRWEKDGTTIANEGGVFNSVTYPGLQVITSNPTTQLDLKISDAKVSYEGSYECEMTPGSGAAQLTVEIQGSEPTIALTQPSTGSLMEGVEGNLTCTATGYRPAVNLLWFRNGNPIQSGITETTSVNGDTTETTSIWTFTPTKDYNEDNIECRTNMTGRISLSRTGSLPLNVRYAPVVTVVYSNKAIVCSADSNPLANKYEIIFNKTEVKERYTTSERSYAFTPYFCTDISCNVTNTIGTGVGEVTGNPICPGKQGLEPAIIVGIVVGVIIAVGVVVIVLVICYYKRLYCFGSNKTKTEYGKSKPSRAP